MKRVTIYLLLAALGIPALAMLGLIFVVGGAIYADTRANNQVLSEYRVQFQDLPHPKNSTRMHHFSHVMFSPGSGDNCWYFVGELRQYSGTKSEIIAFYEGRNVSLDFAAGGEFGERFPYSGFRNLSDWPLKRETYSERDIFIIYRLEPDYFTRPERMTIDGMDLRCL